MEASSGAARGGSLDAAKWLSYMLQDAVVDTPDAVSRKSVNLTSAVQGRAYDLSRGGDDAEKDWADQNKAE